MNYVRYMKYYRNAQFVSALLHVLDYIIHTCTNKSYIVISKEDGSTLYSYYSNVIPRVGEHVCVKQGRFTITSIVHMRTVLLPVIIVDVV